MTKKEMVVILAILKEAFKDFQVTETRTSLWYDLLGDLNFKVVQVAVKKLILQSPYVPTISDIRKQIVEIMHPIIDAAEGYGEVRRAIKEYGYDYAPEAFEGMSPLTRKVCEYIGWQNICLSEEPSVIRGQFLKMYEQLNARQQENALLPERLKEQIKALAGQKALTEKEM